MKANPGIGPAPTPPVDAAQPHWVSEGVIDRRDPVGGAAVKQDRRHEIDPYRPVILVELIVQHGIDF